MVNTQNSWGPESRPCPWAHSHRDDSTTTEPKEWQEVAATAMKYLKQGRKRREKGYPRAQLAIGRVQLVLTNDKKRPESILEQIPMSSFCYILKSPVAKHWTACRACSYKHPSSITKAPVDFSQGWSQLTQHLPSLSPALEHCEGRSMFMDRHVSSAHLTRHIFFL